MFFRAFSAFFAALLLSFPQTTAAAAQGRENVMVVFDGSGSMWGQIDGKAKITIARDAIKEMVNSWNADTNIGLIAYGHRTKGDCSDIETLLPVGALDKNAFTTAVDAIQPKGKTPISAAVRKAAEELKYTENKATVILISDGLETCNADPCALASELEAKGVDFTTNVIGFDINKADSAKLSCLATNTGGQFLSANNAAELNKAISKTVKTVQAKVVKVKAVPKPAPVPKGPQGIKVIPVACETCTEPLQTDISWHLYEAKQDMDGNRKEVGYAGSATALFKTDEGRYFIYGTYGQASKGLEVTVKPGTLSTVKVNFNAGNMRVSAAATAGADPLNDMTYRVYTDKKDLEGNRAEIAYSGSAKPVFKLPAGKYFVVAWHGVAYANAELTVNANELTEYVFDMNVGYLKVNAIPSTDAAVLEDNMTYRVYMDKKDLEGNRKEIAYSGSAKSLFKLPAGKYFVVAQHGLAYANTTIEISANSLTEYTFDMNVGYFRVNAIMTDGMPPIEGNMTYRVYADKKDLEGNRKEIAYSGSAKSLFRLTAGKYFIVARHGQAYSNMEVTVDAGSLLEKTMVINSAMIHVTPTLANGAALAGGVSWRVYAAKADLEGNHKEISYSGSAESTFILPAGDYIFTVRNAEQNHDTNVSLKPGEQKNLTVEIQPN